MQNPEQFYLAVVKRGHQELRTSNDWRLSIIVALCHYWRRTDVTEYIYRSIYVHIYLTIYQPICGRWKNKVGTRNQRLFSVFTFFLFSDMPTRLECFRGILGRKQKWPGILNTDSSGLATVKQNTSNCGIMHPSHNGNPDIMVAPPVSHIRLGWSGPNS